MKTTFHIFSLGFALVIPFALVAGCGPKPVATSPENSATAADHDHDDHDHDEHDHDHPEHGPNGGHMVDMTGGSHVEWAQDDDTEMISVYPENADQVTGVQMKTTIDGKATDYPFTKSDDAVPVVYTLKSPELLTAIKMGDAVVTELVIMTADGESTGKVVHHSH